MTVRISSCLKGGAPDVRRHHRGALTGLGAAVVVAAALIGLLLCGLFLAQCQYALGRGLPGAGEEP